jgi:hypothetical protein
MRSHAVNKKKLENLRDEFTADHRQLQAGRGHGDTLQEDDRE